MSPLRYLRSRLGEFLLVLISAWAVSAVAINGFFLDGIMYQVGYVTRLVMVFAVDFVLMLMLYLAAGTRGNHVSGAIAFIVVAAALVIASLALSGGEDLYSDAEGNYLYFSLVLIISCLACFLLTRSLAGSMAWFVVAAFTCSLIQAFYQCEELPLSVVAAIGALSTIVYRNYSHSDQGAQLGDGKASRFAMPTALVSVLASAGIALVVWFAIIAPLNPGVVDVKLVTEYLRLPILELKGTAQEWPQLNYDMTSDQLVDGDYYTTDDLEIDDESTKEVDAVSIAEQLSAMGISSSDIGEGSGTGSSMASGKTAQYNDNDDPQFDPMSYLTTFPWVLIWLILLAAIIAAIVLFFVLRRRRRNQRLVEYLSQEPNDQIVLIYRFLYKRLGRIGFKRPEGMTLREFAKTSSHSMDMLTEEVGVSFEALTETYIACVYGDYIPTEDDVVPFASYYLRFWKAARAYLGNVKYFFKSFRL